MIQKTIRNAHEGPVFCLLTLKDGRLVSGGGKDGQLVLWDLPSYRRTGYITEVILAMFSSILYRPDPFRLGFSLLSIQRSHIIRNFYIFCYLFIF